MVPKFMGTIKCSASASWSSRFAQHPRSLHTMGGPLLRDEINYSAWRDAWRAARLVVNAPQPQAAQLWPRVYVYDSLPRHSLPSI